MKCIIPGMNVKILARAIQCLAKLGEEMYVQPQQNSISFRTVSMSNSAYGNFTFHENYFSYYVFEDLEEEDVLKCKIPMRSIMAVFKASSIRDKQIETCHIRLQPNATKLMFRLKYRNGIIKTHLLPIIDCEALQAVYTKEGVPVQLVAQSRVLMDAVHNFQQTLLEITLQVTPQKVLLRNYFDETSDILKVTRTQLVLSKGEFDRYMVEDEACITFCMKELRAFLNFAETVAAPISINFETAGRPVVFIMKTASFETNIVLSTLNPDAYSQSEKSITDKREQAKRRKTSNKKPRNKQSTNSVNQRTINQSTKCNRPANNENEDARKNINDNPNMQMDIDQNDDFLLANIDNNILDNTNPAYLNKSYVTENPKEQINKLSPMNVDEPSTSGLSSPFNKSSTRNKNLVQSIFSTVTKRKSDTESSDMLDNQMDEDMVPSSPPRQPAKRARMIFKKCFQTTFDPRMLPGHDTVLVEDSDEHSD